MKMILTRAAAALLALCMLLSLCACGAKKDKTEASEEPAETAVTAEPVVTEEPAETAAPVLEIDKGPVQVTAGVEEDGGVSAEIGVLGGSGEVEVDDGDMTVSVTLPAELVGDDVTQESLDAGGENYTSAVLNEDGSVTYTMSTEQMQSMLDSVAGTIDDQTSAMLENDLFHITNVSHNDDFTVFDVTVDGDSVGLMASMSALALYTSGRIYNVFTGNTDADITVNFLSPDGTVLETGHSSEAGE